MSNGTFPQRRYPPRYQGVHRPYKHPLWGGGGGAGISCSSGTVEAGSSNLEIARSLVNFRRIEGRARCDAWCLNGTSVLGLVFRGAVEPSRVCQVNWGQRI